MNVIKKLLYLNSLLVLLLLFGLQMAWARSDLEIEIDFDADGICGSSISDHPYYLGPTYFCTPNDNGEPDNCPDDANPDQADADDDGIGDVCDEDFPSQGDCDPGFDPDCLEEGDDMDVDPDQVVNIGDDAMTSGGCSLMSGYQTPMTGSWAILILMLGTLGIGRRFHRSQR